LATVDKSCVRAYTALGGKLTVHEWKQVYDPAFGAIVAKSRCGRIVDRRVLIQVVTSQPVCKRCQLLAVAERQQTTERTHSSDRTLRPREENSHDEKDRAARRVQSSSE